MGEIIMRNWDFREFRVGVNLTSLIWQVWVPIRRVITLIWGLLNPIRQVVPLISLVHSYPPYCSHLHPPSLSFSSTTLPSLQEHKVKSSFSISPCHHHEWTQSAAFTKCSIRRVQHTPSAAYAECSIRRVQHTPSAAYAECSIRRVQHKPSTPYTSDCRSSHHSHDFIRAHSHRFKLTTQWIESQHLAHLPSTASRSTTFKYSSNLPRS